MQLVQSGSLVDLALPPGATEPSWLRLEAP